MAMLSHAEIDSRRYAFIFPVRGREHLPADFPVRVNFERVIAGVFLPQEQCDWYQKPRYPARILLLLGDELLAITHPASGEQEVRIALRDVLAIESTRILLDGRLTVYTSECVHTWRYNTRDERHVNEFLFYLRRATMAEERPTRSSKVLIFGEPLDIKFAAAESRELDHDEQLLARIFVAPRLAVQKNWVFKTESWTPGEYLALTSRRVLWITDQCNDFRSQCGSTASYAALQYLFGIRVTHHGQQDGLNVSLCGRLHWQVTLAKGFDDEAESFVECVRSLRSWSESESRR
jgi:hypothetical protein